MSLDKPKVAIITRTKDRTVFLERALKSIANQSFDDYVHVIVNDGGSESQINSLIDSIPKNQRDKTNIFHRKQSSGAPDTIFNESIDRVESDYFAIHDDDDTWHPRFLEETVAHLEAHKNLAAVVVSTSKVSEEIEGISINQLKISQWMPDLKAINLYRQCIDNQLTPISTLFRRSAYVEVGKFDDSLPVVGDWEFGVRLLMKHDVGYLDPGYYLASYHHRKAVGSTQDAISSNEKNRYYTNLVMNKYLRKELDEGRLGVGYIMSQLKYNQSNMATVLKKLVPGFISKRLKRRIQN